MDTELKYKYKIGDRVKHTEQAYQEGTIESLTQRFSIQSPDRFPAYWVRFQDGRLVFANEDDLMLIQSDSLTFRDYAESAATTIVYPDAGLNLVYPTLKLNGEAGELAEKVGKLIRDKGYVPGGGVNYTGIGQADREDLAKELGDVLWYVFALSFELGYELEEIAQMNIDKLQSRKDRGQLQGSGDNR